MIDAAAKILDGWIARFCDLWPDYTFFNMEFNVRGVLAIVLVALICGAVGSMVVANRMSFFSDALAHCAFAGVALGLLFAIFIRVALKDFTEWITLIMIGFGITVGLGIALVREKTSLSSDTVIGVFFAGAIGLGAMVMTATKFPLENFLFGSPWTALSRDLIIFFLLLLVTVGFLVWYYNSMVFTSFNTSLARSRRVPVRLCNYLFIALLGVIINVCLHIVGALLINGLLIVPAAAAANMSRNMKQMFWWSIVICQTVGVAGIWLSWEISLPDPVRGTPIKFGVSGTIVVLSVLVFFLSMILGPRFRERLRQSPSEPAQGLQA
jgi:zinc transport system permease protein